MPADNSAPFEARLAEIFAAGEKTVAERLARERMRADALQAQDTRRFAYTLTEAIEHELKPAVMQALDTYDAAIDRPIAPNARWEAALRSKISHAVEAGVRLAAGTEGVGPWKPLLEKEAPALRERLLALAEAHFVELGKARKAAGRASSPAVQAATGLGIFLAGAAAGAAAMWLVTG